VWRQPEIYVLSVDAEEREIQMIKPGEKEQQEEFFFFFFRAKAKSSKTHHLRLAFTEYSSSRLI